jgi:hypothetical protein
VKTLVRRLAVPIAFSLFAIFAGHAHSEAAGVWHGFAVNDPNVRSAPSASAPVVGTLSTGDPIEVVGWVAGDMVVPVNSTWAELGPGQYVYSANVQKPLPTSPPPPPQTFSGQWIDANLTEQILTAYNGSTPVFWAVMSSGAPGGTETETGLHHILRRVANETMTSASLRFAVAIPYDLTNVLYTQYFTDYGAAIHDNYWKNDTSPFGVPTSHGCMGLREADALKFWNFASVGTLLNIHY